MENVLADINDLVDEGRTDEARELCIREMGVSAERAEEVIASIERTGYTPRPGMSADEMVAGLREATRLMAVGQEDAAIEMFCELTEEPATRASSLLIDRLARPDAPAVDDARLHALIIRLSEERRSNLSATKLYRAQRGCAVDEAMRVVNSLTLLGYPPPEGFSYRQFADELVDIRTHFIFKDEEEAVDRYCELTGEDAEVARQKLEQHKQDWKFRNYPQKGW